MKPYSYDDFLSIMDTLLSENGCPWDRVQTHESLTRSLLEECYETIDAINQKDMDALREELGDVLLGVVFQAKLAEKEGCFTMAEVTDGIARKMINRHRHIFGGDTAETPEAVLDSWDKIKQEEKQYASHTEKLRSVPKTLPALLRADKVQGRAKKAGLSLSAPEDCLQSIRALLADWPADNTADAKKEKMVGDLLFNAVILAGLLQINPEFALTNAIETFINSFEHMEKASNLCGNGLCNAGNTL